MSSNLIFIDSLVGHEKGPMLTAILVSAVLAIFSWLGVTQLKSSKDPAIPDSKLSIRGFFNVFTDMLVWLADSAMGKENRRYLPFLGSLFLFLLCCHGCLCYFYA